jgi:hypothetical protein
MSLFLEYYTEDPEEELWSKNEEGLGSLMSTNNSEDQKSPL